MDATLTLYLAGAALLAAVFCGWRGARPADPNRGVRLMPWRPLMVGCFAAFLVLLTVWYATRQS
jgi:hypothetical protein